jgi:formylglycine-generating enzyme required for sulfatase activity
MTPLVHPLDLIELAAIPGGTFLMGSPESEPGRFPDEGPQHKVTVPPFLMGKYPVTQEQWRIVATLPKNQIDLNPNPSYVEGDDRPVEQVSWFDAVEFCAQLSKATGRNYRLPTEAEWEYACRSGTTTPFHTGNTISVTDGDFRVNAFGLYGMHTNYCEWCQDHWHDTYDGAPNDGSAWLAKGMSFMRVVRGGSWSSPKEFCRSAYRSYSCEGNSATGFRVVCNA